MDESAHQALADYVNGLFAFEDDVLRDALDRSAKRGLPEIHIQAQDGRLLQFLLKAVGARRVIEIGTLGGYSGTWIARALPPDGKLITLDNNPEHAEVAAETFAQAGLGDRVEIKIGPALESLKALEKDGPFDGIFIDANKDGYPAYLAWAIAHLRPGGLILAHNAFFGGSVVGVAQREPALVNGLKAFNQTIASDPRLFGMIIPIGDGIAAAIRL